MADDVFFFPLFEWQFIRQKGKNYIYCTVSYLHSIVRS